jgi:hypothetical protein
MTLEVPLLLLEGAVADVLSGASATAAAAATSCCWCLGTAPAITRLLLLDKLLELHDAGPGVLCSSEPLMFFVGSAAAAAAAAAGNCRRG